MAENPRQHLAALLAKSQQSGMSPSMADAIVAGIQDLPPVSGDGIRVAGGLVVIGDSTSAGADSALYEQYGMSWPNIAALFGKGRLRLVRNAATAGDRIQQMIDRFDADVAPYNPAVVAVMAGTNSVDKADVTLAQCYSQYDELVAKVLAIGALPALCTIVPNNSTGPATGKMKQNIRKLNERIKQMAMNHGWPLIDFFALSADPANGNWKSGYYLDGTHGNNAWTWDAGEYAAGRLLPFLPDCVAVPFANYTGDEISNIYNGCYTASSGTSPSLGWSDAAGTPAGSSLAYGAVSGFGGQAITVTHASAAALRQLVYAQYIGQTTLTNSPAAGTNSIVTPARADYRGILHIGVGAANYEHARIASSSGGGPQTNTLETNLLYAHAAGEVVIANAIPGDVMMLSGMVSSDGGVGFTVDVTCTGAAYSPGALLAMTAGKAVQNGVFARQFTVPAGTTQINVRFTVTAGTGVVSFGHWGLINMSRMSGLWT